jgi:hypothetical protein
LGKTEAALADDIRATMAAHGEICPDLDDAALRVWFARALGQKGAAGTRGSEGRASRLPELSLCRAFLRTLARLSARRRSLGALKRARRRDRIAKPNRAPTALGSPQARPPVLAITRVRP